MPEYTIAALGVVAAAVVVALRTGLLRRRSTWLGLLVFGLCTIAADLILTGLPIVTYGDHHVQAWMLGPMPMEDLLYGLALFLLAAVAWDASAPTRRVPGRRP